MDYSRLWVRSPLFITALGVGLFVVAVGHHTREFLTINELAGPLIALLLDGLPALGLGYAGYWLSQTNLSPRDRWLVFVWCLTGSFLFVVVISATFLLRIFEGRVVAEPVFPLLIATEAGGIAGLVAGYYNAQARTQARRAETVSNALAFTNDLIRHDLRNDLNLIQGHAELINQSSETDEISSGDPEVIVERTDEALTRIETSRVISNTLIGEPDLEPVDLVPIVTELAAHIEDAFTVTVTTDLPSEAFVVANVGLRSVVDNLLENAVEHNDAESPRLDVTVEIEEETVRLSVSDNGSGVPDERKEAVFETDETGAGGLSLVQTLVHGYGGDVWVEDNEMGGSTFVVVLPRAEERPGEMERPRDE